MPYIILTVALAAAFLTAQYFVTKSAINNSEAVKEIKVMLMKAQNEDRNR